MAGKTRIETPEEKQYRETVERIAGNIASLSRAVVAMLKGPLNRRAIAKLLASSSGQSERAVADVLSALETLEKDWLNKN